MRHAVAVDLDLAGQLDDQPDRARPRVFDSDPELFELARIDVDETPLSVRFGVIAVFVRHRSATTSRHRHEPGGPKSDNQQTDKSIVSHFASPSVFVSARRRHPARFESASDQSLEIGAGHRVLLETVEEGVCWPRRIAAPQSHR